MLYGLLSELDRSQAQRKCLEMKNKTEIIQKKMDTDTKNEKAMEQECRTY